MPAKSATGKSVLVAEVKGYVTEWNIYIRYGRGVSHMIVINTYQLNEILCILSGSRKA